jgi:hypothetical protein
VPFSTLVFYETKCIFVSIETKLRQAWLAPQFFCVKLNLCDLCFNQVNLRRSREMDYIKAQTVLPEDLIELIQQYVDGGFIYIPRKDGQRMAWGEKAGTKDCLKQRDNEIYVKYTNGAKVKDLMGKYHLSEPSIRRIIGRERKLSLGRNTYSSE